jgi:glycosyltransferase involved in cell wall biosynthesis
MPATMNHRRRLLFVSPVGFIGGAERVLLECIRQVRARRPEWDVTLLQLDEGPLQDAAGQLGAKVELLPLPNFLSKSGDSKLIRQELEKSESDKENIASSPRASASPSPSASSKIERGEPEENQPRSSSVFRSAKLMPAKFVSSWRFYSQLSKLIRRCHPDLIHSNGLKSHMLLSVAQPRGAKVLWHIHDFYSHRPKIQAWIRRLSKRSTGCFVISDAVAEDIASVIPRLPVHLLENCVDTLRFSPGEPDFQRLDELASLPPNHSGLRMGLIATYANWKGHDAFLKALAKVPNVRGYVIGDPIYATVGSQWTRAQLEALATSLGVRDRVGFISFQSDPAWVYQSLDIVVHASIRPEPFGLTIIEAMSCGRPVIVSDAGGAHDLFTEGHDGIGHVPGDVDSLVKAIDKLATDVRLRANLAQNARQTALQRFSADRFGETLIHVYESTF